MIEEFFVRILGPNLAGMIGTMLFFCGMFFTIVGGLGTFFRRKDR